MKTISLPKQNIHTGNLILVNRLHSYHTENSNTLIPVLEDYSSILMNSRAAVLLSGLMEEIQGWHNIAPVSGWRSMQDQQKIWDNTITERGVDFTEKYVAFPGHSEHQTGLAIDLGLKQENIDFICPDFPYSGICRLFRMRAAHFGFVERYPKGKETITGIGHEPWHFRYVGIPHALIMTENDLTLEEYVEFIKSYPYGGQHYRCRQAGLDVSVSYLGADVSGNTQLDIDTDTPYSISGNNIDGFIITKWRENNAYQAKLRRA